MSFHPLYLDYLYHFHVTRDYFECHESLEELWKETNKKEHHWIPLLQLSVALYHYRRQAYPGAFKLLKNISSSFLQYKNDYTDIGLDALKLHNRVNKILGELDLGLPYESFNLPIIDFDLLKQCKDRATKNHFMWGNASDMSDSYLINKHRMRDRTSIINLRLSNLKNKKDYK